MDEAVVQGSRVSVVGVAGFLNQAGLFEQVVCERAFV